VEEKVTEGKDVKAKAEFLGTRGGDMLKADSEDSDVANVWRKSGLEYPIFCNMAIKLLVAFATTYLYEAGFCTVVNIRTKARNRLDISHGLRCT
jgi:hypothetical protein